MDKIAEFINPSKYVFDLYNSYSNKIKSIIPDADIRLIGSFAIPICGRKELDILVEVENIKDTQEILEKNGFSKGPIVKDEGYMKAIEDGFVIELHILKRNDKRIHKAYMKVINTLKNDSELREKYEKLRWSFNGKSSKDYKKDKSEFLKEHIFNH